MSIYRTILAAVAAIALATPVFAADDAANTMQPATGAAATQASNDSATSTDQQIASTEQSKVNVNKATAKELMKIKGLNASKARAIVAYRKKHGDFKALEDLTGVKGFKKMKPDTIKEIQDQLTIE